jgi:shikimate dehydrogenase
MLTHPAGPGSGSRELASPEGPPLRLGLIGDNILRSQAPRLHVGAGRLCGFRVEYDLLIPADLRLSLDAMLDRCRDEGYRGLNITYSYKERVIEKLRIDDGIVSAIAACNTVIVEGSRILGFNTDYTGFIRAFRHFFGGVPPGVVALVGAGGVGRALAFAFGSLGASRLKAFDSERSKAQALSDALCSTFDGLAVEVVESVADVAAGVDGLVNCTPLGMDGKPGTTVPRAVIGGQEGAIDAVYTPVDTAFLNDARTGGLRVMSGYELFFFQGVDAFKIFTGRDVGEAALRRLLMRPAS